MNGNSQKCGVEAKVDCTSRFEPNFSTLGQSGLFGLADVIKTYDHTTLASILITRFPRVDRRSIPE